jgi:hypothetical protein
MMEKAKELLAMEISEVMETSSENIEQQLLDGLSDCYKNMSARLDS